MSEETSFEESVVTTDLSLSYGSASNTESDNTQTNTSVSDSESSELYGGESSQKKEFGDLFKSGSDIETTASESYSEDIEADRSTSSFIEESIEDVFEVEEPEQDGTGNEAKSFDNSKQVATSSTKSQELSTDAFKADSNTSCFEKGSNQDEQDGAENKSFGNIEHGTTVSTKSPKFVLKTDSATDSASSHKVSIEDSFKDEAIEQDRTGNKSKTFSNAEQSVTAGNKSPQSPTEAMKALSITDSPNSGTKTTPRQSRFRARTVNIFDSPYNTRLKARMIRERDMRSRSEGGSTNE